MFQNLSHNGPIYRASGAKLEQPTTMRESCLAKQSLHSSRESWLVLYWLEASKYTLTSTQRGIIESEMKEIMRWGVIVDRG